MKSIKEMATELDQLTTANQALLDKADTDQDGILSSEQEQEYEKREKDIDELNDKLNKHHANNTRRQKLNKIRDESKDIIGRQTQPTQPGLSLAKGNEDIQKLSISRQELHLEPGSELHARAQGGYSNDFNRFLRTGRKNDSLKEAGEKESLGLRVGDNSRGGYLVSMSFMSKFIKFMDDLVYIRQLATVFPNVSAAGMGAPAWESDPDDANWTPEILPTDMSEDDAIRIGTRELIPHDLSKMILVSRKLLGANAELNIESMIAKRLAYKFAVAEEKAYLTGDGDKKPLGVFTPSDLGIPIGRDVRTGLTTGFDGDDIIEVFNSLKVQYQAKATWIVSREWVKRARKAKTSGGDYIWAPATAGNPSTIHERPYKISEFCPNVFTASKYVAIVGDFEAGYWIADNLDMIVDALYEHYRLRKLVAFIGEKSTDGMPVLGEAFARMQLKA